MSKCLQEDNSNLKGLALFSLHPRAYITTQWAENNIHSRLCLQGTLAIISSTLLLHRDLKTPLESCIKTAQEKYFQAACTTFSLSTKEKEVHFFLPASKTHAHVQNDSANSFFHTVFQTYVTKEPVVSTFIFSNMAFGRLCKRLCFYLFKQCNVKPFYTSAFCWNKWYSHSKAILQSHFSPGKSVQSQFCSASDIKDYKLSKRVCRSARGRI